LSGIEKGLGRENERENKGEWRRGVCVEREKKNTWIHHHYIIVARERRGKREKGKGTSGNG
jgi:hypothetical protein